MTFKRIIVMANFQVCGDLAVLGVPTKGDPEEWHTNWWLWSTRMMLVDKKDPNKKYTVRNEFSPRAQKWDKRTRGYKVLLKAIKYIKDIEALGFDAFNECTVFQELWSEDL